MLSEKGYVLKVYNNFKLSKNKVMKVEQKWTCIEKTCKVHIFTDLEGKNFIKLVHDISSRPAKHVRFYCQKKLEKKFRLVISFAQEYMITYVEGGVYKKNN